MIEMKPLAFFFWSLGSMLFGVLCGFGAAGGFL